MKVYEAVAHAFVKEGTTAVFGLLGDGQLTWWAAMVKHAGVRMIDVRDEGAALSMAEGWARATGKTGVCSVTQGPGISRMTTSLIVATRSRTPIVVYTSRTAFNNDSISQFLDQEQLVGATGAGYIEVLAPSYAENAVRAAFYRARKEARPMVLCVPLEVQGKECDSDGDEYQSSAAIFAGQQRIRPDAQRLNEAAAIIAAASKPVIIVGRGAMQAEAAAAAQQLAQRIGALIATTLHAKGMLGESAYHAGISGLFSTRAVMQLVEEADCVIAIGASLHTQTIEGGYLYPKARVVQIDIAPHLTMGNNRGADCYLQGDAAVTTLAIDALLAQRGVSQAGYRTAAVRAALQDADRDPREFEIEPGTVDPREAARVLDERLPSSVGVVTGVGHCFSFPVMVMQKPRAPYVFVTHFGCIGQALATSIGVCVGRGEPVAYMEGDAGAMQNIQELETAARLGLKLLFVILNDQGLGAEYHLLKVKGLDTRLSAISTPDFGAVGRGFGCRGRVVRSLGELGPAIDEFMAGDGPMVLDIRISRNVISIPYRRLHYAEDA